MSIEPTLEKDKAHPLRITELGGSSPVCSGWGRLMPIPEFIDDQLEAVCYTCYTVATRRAKMRRHEACLEDRTHVS